MAAGGTEASPLQVLIVNESMLIKPKATNISSGSRVRVPVPQCTLRVFLAVVCLGLDCHCRLPIPQCYFLIGSRNVG